MAIEISVYPNPFIHYIMLEITCDENIDCIISLADISQGKIIRMLGAGLVIGTNRIPFENLESHSAGNYQLEITTSSGEAIYRTRLFKQSEEGPFVHLN